MVGLEGGNELRSFNPLRPASTKWLAKMAKVGSGDWNQGMTATHLNIFVICIESEQICEYVMQKL